jgi:hypothetical protein
MKFSSAFLALCIALLVATGCSGSVSIGGKVIDKSDVEKGASDALTKVVGQAPASIVCPDDLDAKVGATERCKLTDDKGNELGMTVTVKSVEGDTANYEVKVDK